MKYVIANWKMNMRLSDIKSWFSAFNKLVSSNNLNLQNINIIVAPSTIYIPIVCEVFKNEFINISAQDSAEFELGAHTGYTGAFQIKEFCNYSIVGHSERKENLETTLLKRDLCLQNNITPIVCFSSPELVNKVNKQNSIIVWEDPSNISINGKYVNKDINEIVDTSKKTRSLLKADATLLYGGSVNRQNVSLLANINELDGVLVGNASLDPSHFFDIVLAFTKK